MELSVLCMDDDPAWRKATAMCVRAALRHIGALVGRLDMVESTDAAAQCLAHTAYDLLTVDLLAGPTNEPTGLRLVREASALCHRPVIVVVSVAASFEAACRDAGADDFVRKSFAPPEESDWCGWLPPERVRRWLQVRSRLRAADAPLCASGPTGSRGTSRSRGALGQAPGSRTSLTVRWEPA
jgi:CheY-like chemotaxis protein